ncbi:hypothetical protein [Halocatena marina]|uniref:Uncharacterized protein n=1 Tax=Halocatena marina TaxID=2934937 RepID=A0ABD5YTL8_9EURY
MTQRGMRSEVVVEGSFVPAVDLLDDEAPTSSAIGYGPEYGANESCAVNVQRSIGRPRTNVSISA